MLGRNVAITDPTGHLRERPEHLALRRSCQIAAMMNAALIVAALVTLMTGPTVESAAIDLAGNWTFTMDPDFRGNRGDVEARVRQEGSTLIVKFEDGVDMKGEIAGHRATWQTPPMTKDRLVARYTATVEANGSAMDGNWTLVGGVLNEKGKFHAKKHR